MFVNENLNPKRRKTGDCVIRAIAKASGEDYVSVLDMLVEEQKKSFCDPGDKANYEKVLDRLGFRKVPVKVMKGDRRPTVREIAKMTDGNYKRIVAAVAHHLVACCRGNYYDIWDCGDKSLYTYYIYD